MIFSSDLFLYWLALKGCRREETQAFSAMALASPCHLRSATLVRHHSKLSHPKHLRAWQKPITFWERRHHPALTNGMHPRTLTVQASGKTQLDGSDGTSASEASPEEGNGVPSSSTSNGHSSMASMPESSRPSNASQDIPSTSAPAIPAHASPPAPSEKGGLPHRWKVVAMIAVAFVLGEFHFNLNDFTLRILKRSILCLKRRPLHFSTGS